MELRLFIDRECHVVRYVQDKTLLVPALGIVLTIFAITMMEHELNRLLPVRDRYRELQPLVLGVPEIREASIFTFGTRIRVYLWTLCGLQVVNMFFLNSYWIPEIEKACKL